MKQNIRTNQLNIKFTDNELIKFEDLFNTLQTELNISPKRQSEIIIEGFFQYADKLLSSKSLHTQTIQQLNNKEIKIDILNKIKGFINSKPKTLTQTFNYFFRVFGKDLGSYRTRFQWFKNLFESEEFVVLNLKSYFGDYYIIPKNSYFHSQFKEHCFNFPVANLNYQPTAELPAKKTIYQFLNMRYQNGSDNLDKVEKFSLLMFKSLINGDEKPMNNEPIISEVLELRSKWKHAEALKLLKEEKVFIANQKLQVEDTKAFEFLEGLAE